MRLLCAAFVILCLVTSAFALSDETKNEIIKIYNVTVDMYAKIIGIFDDLDSTMVEVERAEDKIEEWGNAYAQETSLAPSEARKMCALMSEVLKAAKKAAEDYEPANRRTKDALAEMEEAKTALKQEMTDVKYMVD